MLQELTRQREMFPQEMKSDLEREFRMTSTNLEHIKAHVKWLKFEGAYYLRIQVSSDCHLFTTPLVKYIFLLGRMISALRMFCSCGYQPATHMELMPLQSHEI